jgi:hypothetical protein
MMESLKVGGVNGVVDASFTSTVSDLVAALGPFLEGKKPKDEPSVGGAGQVQPAQGGGTLK